MSKFELNSVSPEELLKLVKKAGGQRAFAKKHGLARTTVQDRLHKLKRGGHKPAPVAKRVGDKRGVRRFILTSAQDSTMVHETFLANLEAYRDWLQQSGDCELMVGGYTYGKSLFEDHSVKAASWPDRVKPYLVSERIRIADRIDFCAETNVLPTAATPLNDKKTYTQDRWGIFPHAKVQLISVNRLAHLPPKQIMTTGTISRPNYVMKNAGIKAAFNHVYGAVLVEIDRDGDFFCRHLLSDDTGVFYDLDRKVEKGLVTQGHRLSALAPGDLHVAGIDPVISKAVFGTWPTDKRGDPKREPRIWQNDQTLPTLLGILRPENLFLHDTLDQRARNHHGMNDPHERMRLYVLGLESVSGEIWEVSRFLDYVARTNPDMQVHIVDSNHDQALERWLKTADYKTDPINAIFFLKLQTAFYEAIEEQRRFQTFKEAVRTTLYPCDKVKFLREDKDPVNINGVEYASHGHRGPGGSKGSVPALAQVSSKMVIGHVHKPEILNGLYAAGMSCLMDQGYNKGITGWSPTLVGQYPNAKRFMITFQGEKWCVPV